MEEIDIKDFYMCINVYQSEMLYVFILIETKDD